MSGQPPDKDATLLRVWQAGQARRISQDSTVSDVEMDGSLGEATCGSDARHSAWVPSLDEEAAIAAVLDRDAGSADAVDESERAADAWAAARVADDDDGAYPYLRLRRQRAVLEVDARVSRDARVHCRSRCPPFCPCSDSEEEYLSAGGSATAIAALTAALKGAEYAPGFRTFMDAASTLYVMKESSTKGAVVAFASFMLRHGATRATPLGDELCELVDELDDGQFARVMLEQIRQDAEHEMSEGELYVRDVGIVRIVQQKVGTAEARVRRPEITHDELVRRIAAVDDVRSMARARGATPEEEDALARLAAAGATLPEFGDCVAVGLWADMTERIFRSWNNPHRPTANTVWGAILRNPVAAMLWTLLQSTFTTRLPEALRIPILRLCDKMGGSVSEVLKMIWDLFVYMKDMVVSMYYNTWDDFTKHLTTVASLHAAVITLETQIRDDPKCYTVGEALARVAAMEKALLKLIARATDRNNVGLVACHRAVIDLRAFVQATWGSATIPQAVVFHFLGSPGLGKTGLGSQLLDILCRRADQSGNKTLPNRIHRMVKAKHQETFTSACIALLMEDAFAVHIEKTPGVENPLHTIMRLGDGTPLHFEHAHLDLKMQAGAAIKYAVLTDNVEPQYSSWGAQDTDAVLRRITYHVFFHDRPAGRPETSAEYDEVEATVMEGDPGGQVGPAGLRPRRIIGRWKRADLLSNLVRLAEMKRSTYDVRHNALANPVSCDTCLLPAGSCLCVREAAGGVAGVAVPARDFAYAAAALAAMSAFLMTGFGYATWATAVVSTGLALATSAPMLAYEGGAFVGVMSTRFTAGRWYGVWRTYVECLTLLRIAMHDPLAWTDATFRRVANRALVTGRHSAVHGVLIARRVRSWSADERVVAAFAVLTAGIATYAASRAVSVFVGRWGEPVVAPPVEATRPQSSVVPRDGVAAGNVTAGVLPPVLDIPSSQDAALQDAARAIVPSIVRVYSPKLSMTVAMGIAYAPRHVVTVAHILDSVRAPPRIAVRAPGTYANQPVCQLMPQAAVSVDNGSDVARFFDMYAAPPSPFQFVSPDWREGEIHRVACFAEGGTKIVLADGARSKSVGTYRDPTGQLYTLDGMYWLQTQMTFGDCGTPVLAMHEGNPVVIGFVCAVSADRRHVLVRPLQGMLSWRSELAPPEAPPVTDYLAAARELGRELVVGEVHDCSPWRYAARVGHVLGTMKPRIGESTKSRMVATPYAERVYAAWPEAVRYVAPSPAVVADYDCGGKTVSGNFWVKRICQALTSDTELWVRPGAYELAELVAARALSAARASSVPVDRELTIDEALNGVGRLRGVNVTTSAGAEPGGGRKVAHLVELPATADGRRRWGLSEALAARVECARAALVRYRLPALFGMATWKSNQAVEPGKPPRAIFWGPMRLLVLARQYLGAFAMSLSLSPAICGCVVGVNAWNPHEWRALYDWLHGAAVEGDLVVVDLDYSGFDARTRLSDWILPAWCVRAFLVGALWTASLVCAALAALWSYLASPYIIRSEVVFTDWTTSGWFATSEFNSLVDYIKLVCAVAQVTGLSAVQVASCVRMIVYGDDVNLAFSATWARAHGLDPDSLLVAMRAVGGHITDGVDKTRAPVFRSSAADVRFLKRARRVAMRDGRAYMLAPLAWDSVLRSLTMYEPSRETTVRVQDQLVGALRSAVDEAWQHGEDRFAEMRAFAMKEAAALDVAVVFPTYDELWERAVQGRLVAPWVGPGEESDR